MFLQLTDKHLAQTDNTGESEHLSSVGGGANLDNGAPGDDLPIGMALDPPNPPNGGDGWTLAASSGPTMTETSDAPLFPVPLNYQYLTVNTWMFFTYVMYEATTPQGDPYGVWVALEELDWSWTGSATNNPWPQGTATAVSGGTTYTPDGEDAFPSWTYDTSDLTWQPGL